MPSVFQILSLEILNIVMNHVDSIVIKIITRKFRKCVGYLTLPITNLPVNRANPDLNVNL